MDKKNYFYALQAIYFDGMVRRLNDATFFNFSEFSVDTIPQKFEDLAELFFCSPLNRGILRQDIDEAALLFKVISSLDRPIGIEIGRFYGGSTILIATAIGEGGKLISIDISPKNNDRDLKNVVKRLGFDSKVELLIGDANQIVINEDIDFAFIDGDHSYEGARLDHNLWGQKVKVGGFLIHHDMANSRRHSVQWHDLELLYYDILEVQKECLKVYQVAGSMVVFQKISNNWKNIERKSGKSNTNVSGVQSKNNSYLNREE